MNLFKTIITNFMVLILLFVGIEIFFIFNKKYFLIKPIKKTTIAEYKNVGRHLNLKVENYTSKYPDSEDVSLKDKTVEDLDYSRKLGENTNYENWNNFNTKDFESVVKLKDLDLVIYKVKFNFEYEDQKGRGFRKSSFMNRQAKKFILNIGDSIVLGEGVEQDYTLSSFLNKKLRNYNNYNFGVPGAGPNDHLKLLQNGIDRRYMGVKEKSGLIIYHHIGFHLHRAACTMRCFSPKYKYRIDKPQYRFVDNQLKLVGKKYLDGELLGFIYRNLAKLETLKFFDIDFPLRYELDDYLLYVNIISAVMGEYEKNLGASEKIIVLYPDTPTVDAENIIKLAQSLNIKVLNFSGYSPSVELIKTSLAIPIDGHPTPEYNNYLSELIAEKLKTY